MTSKETDAATARKVELAIAAVRAYWDEGAGVIAEHGSSRLPYTPREEQELTPSQRERRRKARQFARTYSEADLATLFDLCRARGYAITAGHVDKLATVANPTRRAQLQRRAVEGNWSRREIARELQRMFKGSRKPKAGRPPEIPPGSAVHRLCEWCGQWSRLAEALDAHRDALTPAMRRRIKAAGTQIEALGELAAKHRDAKPPPPLKKIKRDDEHYGV